MQGMKRHILWQEPGVRAVDPITGAVLELPDGSCLADLDRASGFYFLAQPRCTWANWELTYRCPQECLHCFQPKGLPAADPHLTPEAIRHALRILQTWLPGEISLTGGDPATVANLPEVIRATTEALPRADIRILTTGPGLAERDDLAELLRLCAQVGATLHFTALSGCHDAHDAVVGRQGSFQALAEMHAACAEAGLRTEIRLHLLRGGPSDWSQDLEVIAGLGPDVLHFSSLLYPPRAGTTDCRWRELLPTIADIRAALCDDLFTAIAAEYVSFEPLCASGCQVLTILPDGRIAGCDVAPMDSAACDAAAAADCADLWRARQTRPSECGECEWRDWCRFCRPAWDGLGEHYCRLVGSAARHVRRRSAQYIGQGAAPVEPETFPAALRGGAGGGPGD